jgi:hypothetical protein
MLWTLINSCCWDVAAALATHATNVEPAAAMAANAAAGKWPAVVSALLAEHERSVFCPKWVLTVASRSIQEGFCAFLGLP